jgi:ribosome modulation factor
MILRGKKKEEGQSTVEFALTLMLLLGFVFFFMQLSLIYGLGSYVHYATFMSARAYLSAGTSEDDQASRAKQVIISTLKAGQTLENRDRFPTVKATGGSAGIMGMDIGDSHYQAGNRNLSWLQGVRYTFKSRFFLLPLVPNSPNSGSTGQSAGSSAQDPGVVQLSSESWLGREPSDGECQKQLGTMNGIYDNGC